MIADIIRKLYPAFESKKEMEKRLTNTVHDLQKQIAFKEGQHYSPIHVVQDRKDAFEIVLNYTLDDKPIDYIKEIMIRQMAHQLENVVVWDIKDAETVPRKILIGSLYVQLRKEDPFDERFRNRRR